MRQLLSALLLVAIGCHPALTPLSPTPRPAPVDVCDGESGASGANGGSSPCRDSVVITYLGVSGFVIRGGPLGDSALMTAPSFTHQRLLSVTLPFIPIRPDGPLIDRSLASEQLGGVSAILVGHSHYDHLLDVPYIAAHQARSAVIYGSTTTANILAPVDSLRSRVHAIEAADVGTTERAGRWFTVAGGRARLMAVESDHAPNIGPFRYTYANSVDDTPRASLPRTTHGWHKGQVYAYLIDLLDASGRPVFRIFYQDAAAGPEHATLPPLAPADRRVVDVAIICAGNFGNVADYPTALLRNLAPKRVVVGHWEDFFRTSYPPFRGISFTDTQTLSARLRETVGDRWVTPEPGARMVFRY
jgi:beta-lactamase family protein